MSVSVLTLIVFLLIELCALGVAPAQSPSKLEQSVQSSPSPAPSPWPNLDIVKTPDGKKCGLDGQPHGNPERAAQNRLRNRYHLPQNGFENLSLQDLEHAPLLQGEVVEEKKLVKRKKLVTKKSLVNYPLSGDKNQERAVSVVGYVVSVLVLGCGAVVPDAVIVPRPRGKGVESALCYTNAPDLCTTQILVTPDPKLPHNDGRNLFVVNVTRRSRWLAARNYLNSNIGKDWSTGTLKAKIEGKWVRFSGWLFFNQNYRERAWISDPDDVIGKSNDRQSSWAIFPVMGIQLVDGPTPSGK